MTSSLNITAFSTRRIRAKPRTVRVAKDFVCPSDLQWAFGALRLKVEKGDDLGPHQHIDYGGADFDDDLLNDWGIHHLHLSTSMRPDGFVERSGPLLFARLTDNDFYCIKIMMHGGGDNPWSRQELIDIIYQNWPESIDHSRLRGPPGMEVVGLERLHTDEEIGLLRRKGVYVFTQRADGTTHLPIGGGSTSAGVSLIVAMDRDRLHYQCRDLETAIKEKLTERIAVFVKEGKCAPGAQLKFQVKVADGGVLAVEETSNLEFNLGFQLSVSPIT